MFINILKKATILLVIYIIVIIGIFVLQFKNDSIISEKLGNLHITLFESTADNKTTSLKNKYTISFNGLSLNADDENSAKIKINNKEQNIILQSWEKTSPLSCELKFSQNVNLIFSVNDDSARAFFNIQADFPANVSSVKLPFSLSAGSTIVPLSDSKIQVTNKKISWELNSAQIEDTNIILNKKTPTASYAFIDKTRSFSFSMATTIDSSSTSIYENTLESLKNNLISSFQQILPDSTTVSEQEAVSYVAAMAEKGKYNEGIDFVPQYFKKNASRTYLSAPYFNNLVKTNETLQRQMQTYSDMINIAAETNTYDIFNVKNVSDYMCMHPGSEPINKLLKNVANSDFINVGTIQAAGILSVYSELYQKNENLAELLKNAAPKCVEKIENSCNLDNSIITITEKGTFLSVINAVFIGDALLRYGKIVKNSDYISAGQLIINSYLKDNASFDLRTLSELYPIVIHNNKFYPHFELMTFDYGKSVWAWTCASGISYSNDGNGTISINIDFPLSYTHYVILNGIKPFKTIYIYDMAFRTDPRFETYNSSGYVYQRDNEILLLKSRHRSQIEEIKFLSESAQQTKEEQEKIGDSEE